ncbi:MAG: hypothetical protein KJO51_06275, partial [Gramella sp.]|nr:hypothetical protein [Christiangramia sp.]
MTDIPDTTYLGENVIYEQDSNNNDSSTGKVLPYLLAGIYFIGFLIYLGRFARNLKSLLQDIRSNKKFRKLNYVFVLLERKISPFTFLNYIFLNRTEYRNNAISKAILEHEKVHV